MNVARTVRTPLLVTSATLLVVGVVAVHVLQRMLPATDRADEELRALGVAGDAAAAAVDPIRDLALSGAWIVVIAGLGGFLASLLVTRRIRRRLVEPILELDRVLTANARGEPDRRCRPLDAPQELRAVIRRVNELLDRAGPAPRG